MRRYKPPPCRQSLVGGHYQREYRSGSRQTFPAVYETDFGRAPNRTSPQVRGADSARQLPRKCWNEGAVTPARKSTFYLRSVKDRCADPSSRAFFVAASRMSHESYPLTFDRTASRPKRPRFSTTPKFMMIPSRLRLRSQKHERIDGAQVLKVQLLWFHADLAWPCCVCLVFPFSSYCVSSFRWKSFWPCGGRSSQEACRPTNTPGSRSS